MSKSLGSYDKGATDQEFAALGGVRWEQVLGWQKVPVLFDVSMIKSAKQEIEEGFHPSMMIPNPDYNHALDGCVANGAAPQLADFPKDHAAWERLPWIKFKHRSPRQPPMELLDSIGEEVRWRGSWPLFHSPSSAQLVEATLTEKAERAINAAQQITSEDDLVKARLENYTATLYSNAALAMFKELAIILNEHAFLDRKLFDKSWMLTSKAMKEAVGARFEIGLKLARILETRAKSMKERFGTQDDKNEAEWRKAVEEAYSLYSEASEIKRIAHSRVDRHAEKLAEIKNVLKNGATEPEWLRQAMIWMPSREDKRTAFTRILTHQEAILEFITDKKLGPIVLTAASAQEILQSLDLLNSKFQSAVVRKAEDPVLTATEVMGEALLEIISGVPSPAAPALQVVKWARRGWKAIKTAGKVVKSVRKISHAQKGSVRIIEASEKVEKMADRIRATMRSQKLASGKKWPSTFDMCEDLDSILLPATNPGSTQPVRSLHDVLEQVEGVHLPAGKATKPAPEARSLEDMLRSLDEIKVPTHEVHIDSESAGVSNSGELRRAKSSQLSKDKPGSASGEASTGKKQALIERATGGMPDANQDHGKGTGVIFDLLLSRLEQVSRVEASTPSFLDLVLDSITTVR